MRKAPTAIIVVLALAAFAGTAGIAIVMMRAATSRVRTSQQVLASIDPAELLAACREVHAKQLIYRQNPDWHNVPPGGHAYPDPHDERIPSPIRRLRPSSIKVEGDHVRVDLGGGWHHYSFYGYIRAPSQPPGHKIIDGLFYFDGDHPTGRE